MSWSCYTFTNRIFGCSYYKEENNYAKILRITLNKLVMEYKKHSDADLSSSFYNLFIQQYKNRPFSGQNLVYSKDKEQFESLCLDSAEALTAFFIKYRPTNLLEEYNWRAKIKGYIGCKIVINDVEYNVDFSMYGTKDAFYNLYYNRFNNWIYNEVTGCENDMLVFVVPANRYYLLKYDKKDYTIEHGFLSQNINKKTHRPGNQCLTCKVKFCKPRLISDLERI
jgi:hypothetical protein